MDENEDTAYLNLVKGAKAIFGEKCIVMFILKMHQFPCLLGLVFGGPTEEAPSPPCQ